MTGHHPLKVDGHSIVDIRCTAEKIVEAFVALPIKGKNGTGRRQDQEGGLLSLFRCHDGKTWTEPDVVGFFPSDKRRKYLEFSQEKGRRLFLNRTHLSSYQSRDVKSKCFGGAIRSKYLILSFSGLPELGDEAVCLALAVHFKWISMEEAKKIISLSDNKIFHALMKTVSRLPASN